MKFIKDNFYIKKLFNLIIFLPIISFFVGFYLNENSAGMGNYAADSDWIRENIKIFLENNLRDAVLHPDLFGNRTPLIYVLNKLFNPFFGNFETYRASVFVISIFGPIFFYFLLKLRFNFVDKKILFLISSFIYLSPYYRTSAYWGLNENYSIISTTLTFLFFQNYLLNQKNKNIFLILSILFSSVTVYFDLKFLIVPLICLIKFITINKNFKKIFLIFFAYFLLALPYFYLIYKWEGIVPKATQLANPKSITSTTDLNNLYLIHLGYAATLISFYLLPAILFIEKNIILKTKEIFSIKINYILLLLITIYILCNLLFFDFKRFTVDEYWVGLGVVHKLSLFLTSNIFYQEIITYFFFICSFIVLIFIFNQSKRDFYILIYFLIISLFLWPLMQEYFDPIILILVFSVFSSVKYFNKLNSVIAFSYLSTLLIIANLYYN